MFIKIKKQKIFELLYQIGDKTLPAARDKRHKRYVVIFTAENSGAISCLSKGLSLSVRFFIKCEAAVIHLPLISTYITKMNKICAFILPHPYLFPNIYFLFLFVHLFIFNVIIHHFRFT